MNVFLKERFLNLCTLVGESKANEMLRILRLDLFDTPIKSLDSLDESHVDQMATAIDRLLNSEPVQYVVGKAWFYGMPLFVNQSVLIPRPETEELVEHAVKLLEKKFSNPTVLDIGTGSGCIALAIKKLLTQSQVIGMDISESALDLAKKNGACLGLPVTWMKADIFSEDLWMDRRFDCIISNPPYIPYSEIEHISFETLNYEPHIALFTEDQSGLNFYLRIIEFAQTHLNPGGVILFECNEFTAETLLKTIIELGYTDVNLIEDIEGKKRILIIQ